MAGTKRQVLAGTKRMQESDRTASLEQPCPSPDRVTATHAALRGGYATHVVTHLESAEALLAAA